MKPWEYPIVRVPCKWGGYRTLHHPRLMQGCRDQADFEGWVVLLISGGVGWIMLGEFETAWGFLPLLVAALAALKLYVAGRMWARDDATYFEHVDEKFQQQGATTMTAPPEHYTHMLQVIFHQPAADHADSSRRWTLQWKPTGGEEELVDFDMHFADGSGGGGKMRLKRHIIDGILRDVAMGLEVNLTVKLTDFIEE